MKPEERCPKGCESDHGGDCWGYLRKCPRCARRVCYADGAHPDPPGLDGLCDACWSETHANAAPPSTEWRADGIADALDPDYDY